jgi:hypothetical protein
MVIIISDFGWLRVESIASCPGSVRRRPAESDVQCAA